MTYRELVTKVEADIVPYSDEIKNYKYECVCVIKIEYFGHAGLWYNSNELTGTPTISHLYFSRPPHIP